MYAILGGMLTDNLLYFSSIKLTVCQVLSQFGRCTASDLLRKFLTLNN